MFPICSHANTGLSTGFRKQRQALPPDRREFSGRETADAGADLASIAEFEDVAEVLLRIEIVVDVLVILPALDDRVAARLEAFGRRLGVGVEQLDVMQALAVLLEELVVDRVTRHRLDEFDLSVAAPRA